MMMTMSWKLRGILFVFTASLFMFTLLLHNEKTVIAPNVQSYLQDNGMVMIPTGNAPEDCIDDWHYDPCVFFLGHQDQYHLGDNIFIEILLKNTTHMKEDKSDIILVFAMDTANGAGATAEVIYQGHGKYMAILKALWVGRATIHVILRATGTALHKLNQTLINGSFGRQYFCVFQYQSFSETTTAYLVMDENRSAKNMFCNLMLENYGYPLYCVKPKRRELQCTDWTSTTSKKTKNFLNFSTEILRGIEVKPLNTQLAVSVISWDNTTLFRSAVSCDRKKFVETWNNSPPIGFFYKKQWFSTHCNGVTSGSEGVKSCLTNRTIRLFGDSTIRQMFFDLMEIMPSQLITEDINNSRNPVGHRPMKAYSKAWNTTIYWGLHGIPLAYETMHRGVARPIHASLDLVPSNSHDIILISIFAHFVLQHQNIFREHIQRISKSVQSLLLRSPDVVIAIKAPHSILQTKTSFYNVIGVVGYLFRQIILEEFRELQSKVIFLDDLDLSIAMKNDDLHPDKVVVKAMVDHLLLYACTDN